MSLFQEEIHRACNSLWLLQAADGHHMGNTDQAGRSDKPTCSGSGDITVSLVQIWAFGFCPLLVPQGDHVQFQVPWAELVTRTRGARRASASASG